MLTGEVVPRRYWSTLVTPGEHGSATGRFWLARGRGVTCFGLTGLALASKGLLAARHGVHRVVSSPVAGRSALRFVSGLPRADELHREPTRWGRLYRGGV